MSTTEDDFDSLNEWVTVSNGPAKSDTMISNGSRFMEIFFDVPVDRFTDLKQIKNHREDFTMVWMDPLLDFEDLHTQEVANKLSGMCKVFDDIASCLTYIERECERERDSIVLIISGSCAKQCLPSFHSISLVNSIVIYCAEYEKYLWMKTAYKKVVACVQTEEDLVKQVHNLMTVKCQTQFYPVDQTGNDCFVWSQLLLDVLLALPVSDDNAKEEMLGMCRTYYQGNYIEMVKMDEFQKTYSADVAIRWYTRESFIYRLINKALRTENIEMIYSFRHYICDLYAQLENARINTKCRAFESGSKVYRGAMISCSELHQYKSLRGSLISANGFFSTSRSYNVAYAFIQQTVCKNYMPGLFVINVDWNNNRSASYADISEYSYYDNEEEVLFNPFSVFRITNIDYCNDEKVWEINMTSISTDEVPHAAKLRELFQNRCIKQNGPDQNSYAAPLLLPSIHDPFFKRINPYFDDILELKKLYVQLGSSYSSRTMYNYDKARLIQKRAAEHRRILSAYYRFDYNSCANLRPMEIFEDGNDLYKKADWTGVKSELFIVPYYGLSRAAMLPIIYMKYAEDDKNKFLHWQAVGKNGEYPRTYLNMNTENASRQNHIREPLLCFDMSKKQLKNEEEFLFKAFSEFSTTFVNEVPQSIKLALECQINHQVLYWISSETTEAALESFEAEWLRIYCLNTNVERRSFDEFASLQPSTTFVSTIEQLVSRLYHDLGQYYCCIADEVLRGTNDSVTVKHLLFKSARCYELLAEITKAMIERHKSLTD